MANLFKRPGRVAQLGRNGFDMSQRRIFSSPCGMLLPTYTDFANPGDKYRLNSRSFVRTEALQSAAFTRLRAHLDWFFVPITQIYSLWNEFYNGTNDVMSSIFANSSSAPRSVLPSFSASTLALPFSYQSTSNRNEGNVKVDSTKGRVTYMVDEFGIPRLWNARRLWTMLYGEQFLTSSSSGTSVSPLSLMAYHKIFHSHYRNTYYTKNDPNSYSLDRFYAHDASGDYGLWDLLKIHYRPWRRDLYSFLQPAPVWSSNFVDYLSRSPFGNIDINPESSALNEITFPPSASPKLEQGSVTPTILPRGNAPAAARYISGLSVGDIRAAFAVDKLLRITAQTGSHYDEQTLAHFGYKMPQGIANEAYFLGEQSLDININEVVATASTGVDAAGGTIGDIAGKGFGSTQNSHDIEFTCPCHGYIMAIWSIEPLPEYYNSGDVTRDYKTSFDFFHPEFDGLGMEPVKSLFSAPSPLASHIVGWRWRYMEHKTKLDIADESVYATYRQSWMASREQSYSVGFYKTIDYLQSRFYIFPQFTNSIFLVDVPSYTEIDWTPPLDGKADTNSSLGFTYSSGDDLSSLPWSFDLSSSVDKIYASDNFINVVDHKVFKTSVMQVYSLPRM